MPSSLGACRDLRQHIPSPPPNWTEQSAAFKIGPIVLYLYPSDLSPLPFFLFFFLFSFFFPPFCGMYKWDQTRSRVTPMVAWRYDPGSFPRCICTIRILQAWVHFPAACLFHCRNATIGAVGLNLFPGFFAITNHAAACEDTDEGVGEKKRDRAEWKEKSHPIRFICISCHKDESTWVQIVN